MKFDWCSQLAGNTYHHGDLKSALLSAAREIVGTKGAEALSLRSIAAEVGVSHMAPYAHFKNKKALLQSVAGFGFSGLAEQLQKVKDDTIEPSEQVLLYGVQYVEYAVANPQLYRLMLNQMHQIIESGDAKSQDVPDSVKELAEGSKKPYILLRDAFARSKSGDSEEIKIQVKASAQGAWAMVHGLSLLMIDDHIRIPEGMDTRTYLAMAAVQKDF